MTTTVLSDARRDLYHGLRLIRRNPGLSAVAIATVALAIAGNTAVFSIVNALLFKPLEAADARRLVRIHPGESGMSLPNFLEIREKATSFVDLVAQRTSTAAAAIGQNPARVRAAIVTTNYFSAMGVPALIGRPFLPSDTRTDLAVIGERFWRTQLAGDAAVLGHALVIDGRSYEVVGVMPRRFRGVAPPGFTFDVWFPIDPAGRDQRVRNDRTAAAFEVFGRLKPESNATTASSELRLLFQTLAAEHPEVRLRPEATEVFALSGFGLFRGLGKTLLPVFAFLALLTIIAGCVLLIGCANIAGLLIGQGLARRREIAVRLALGAGRGRVVRQLLTESAVLAIVGGLAGVLLATWLVARLPTLVDSLPVRLELDMALDRRVLAYAIVLTTATALLFGLAPARRASRADVIPALKDESASRRGSRLRHALVIGQVLVCSLLLAWSLLFARSLARLSQVNPGFDPSGVLVATLSVEEGQALSDGAARFADLQRKAESLPGVESVGMTFAIPLSLAGRQEYGVELTDRGASDDVRRVMGNVVTPGYFATLRIPFQAGRDFTPRDNPGAPAVVIVNETAARRFWNGSAIGRHVRIPRHDQPVDAEVVGVVHDSKYWTIGETIAPTFYVPLQQEPIREMSLMVRGRDAHVAAASLRTELLRVASTAVEIKPLTDVLSVALLPARTGAVLTSTFGAIASLLAAIGIYGLVSFTVAQRTREIGIRKAVGARTSDIIRLVLGGSLSRVAAGLAGGLLLAGLVSRGFAGFVVGVSVFDPVAIATTASIVLGAAIAASVIPALRATRVDPIVTLRAE